MTLVVEFTVTGEPISKARARFTGKGSATRSYTPKRTMDGERAVADAFRAVAPNHQPLDDVTYRVDATFYCGTRQRRDVDNMLKLICDALNKIAWGDDNQVTEAHVAKLLVEPPDARTVVTITELGPVDVRLAVCEHCRGEYKTYQSWNGKRRYCSAECRNEHRIEKNRRTCETCGKDFQSTRDAKFCTQRCATRGETVTQPCAECGTDVVRPASWSDNGNPFCSDDHRVAYHRQNRAKNAKGVCPKCGGPMSKKSYKQCRACFVTAQVAPVPAVKDTER
jgi:Holliday junction resolvase RusA-like endonuclease/endogenous inhibitor of DNA gyrase (YacG/DUF329 family)